MIFSAQHAIFGSNVGTDQTSQDHVPTFNPASGCTDVHIAMEGTGMGRNGIPSGGQVTPTFPIVVNGPVQVTSNVNVFTSEQVMKVPYNSLNEVMGFPNNQRTNDYWFHWYDDVNMTTWVLVGNP